MKKTSYVKPVVYIAMFVSAVLISSCRKFLDEKPDQQLLVPTSVEDLQPLLDDYIPVNYNDPYYPNVASDDYFIPDGNWTGLNQLEKNIHTWQRSEVFRIGRNDWTLAYSNVFRANTVLAEASRINIPTGSSQAYAALLGHAYFIRSKAFLQGAWIWCNAYDPVTASIDLGLPLRLDPDFNIPSVRSNVEETYRQIISDIKLAIQLLPDQSVHVMRPSKAAAHALLARTYLSMRMYDSCAKYASFSLALKDELMDYNGDPDINFSSNYPFRAFNKEVIYESRHGYPSSIFYGVLDSLLLMSYKDGDLRKELFSRSTFINRWKGNYCGNAEMFCGIATDEVWLMLSESQARTGHITEALSALNKLMSKRWKSDLFVPCSESDQGRLVTIILQERRKELLLRGLRWMDLKRFNKEGQNLRPERRILGKVFSIEPNSGEFAAPIPEDVINQSGMQQNP